MGSRTRGADAAAPSSRESHDRARRPLPALRPRPRGLLRRVVVGPARGAVARPGPSGRRARPARRGRRPDPARRGDARAGGAARRRGRRALGRGARRARGAQHGRDGDHPSGGPGAVADRAPRLRHRVPARRRRVARRPHRPPRGRGRRRPGEHRRRGGAAGGRARSGEGRRDPVPRRPGGGRGGGARPARPAAPRALHDARPPARADRDPDRLRRLHRGRGDPAPAPGAHGAALAGDRLPPRLEPLADAVDDRRGGRQGAAGQRRGGEGSRC